MQKRKQTDLESDDWVTVRDFVDDGDGFTLPRYEAKHVADVDRAYVEDDLILLKKTDSLSGTEHMYHLPREVFEGITGRL